MKFSSLFSVLYLNPQLPKYRLYLTLGFHCSGDGGGGGGGGSSSSSSSRRRRRRRSRSRSSVSSIFRQQA
jgi:hypothetical protein